jgi:hypothetical protein
VNELAIKDDLNGLGQSYAIRKLETSDLSHRDDRRSERRPLFTADTHFVGYMNAKDPKPSQELHSREAHALVIADFEQVRHHHALRRAEYDP